jgi:Protein of unknown function (DUF1566)
MYAYVDVNGDVVADGLTGLSWTADGQGNAVWADAPSVCTALNDAGVLAGIVDWRIPSALELASLFDLGAAGKKLPALFLAAGSSTYWSATPVSGVAGQRYAAYFGQTATINKVAETESRSVLCVAGALPPSTLQLEADVITDPRTRLVWQRGAGVSGVDWMTALAYCASLDLDGASDWRLPTSKEFFTIVDASKSTPPIFRDGLYWNGTGQYWSSTPVQASPGFAYRVTASASQFSGDTTENGGYINARCVRSPGG